MTCLQRSVSTLTIIIQLKNTPFVNLWHIYRGLFITDNLSPSLKGVDRIQVEHTKLPCNFHARRQRTRCKCVSICVDRFKSSYECDFVPCWAFSALVNSPSLSLLLYLELVAKCEPLALNNEFFSSARQRDGFLSTPVSMKM